MTGDKNVFHLRPSSQTLTWPVADVGDGELLLTVEYPDDTPADIRGGAARLSKEVEVYLSCAQSDIAYFNSGLLNDAQMTIRRRRQRIESHRAHLETTGLPIGPPRDESKTYIADVIIRRPAPLLPAMRQEQPIELEPVLGDGVYEHLLTDIRQHTLSMEKNPQTYAGMGEEDRRNVIRDALNANYHGTPTAEGCNFGGKTDILIRHEGRNLFIAECKFWTGAKGFTDTLDQLFGYQAWRDTKLAVLMFVRERDLITIIERGREALEAHRQVVERRQAASETELRAIVSWEGDERRHADLNVFFISTPTDAQIVPVVLRPRRLESEDTAWAA